MSLVAVGGDAGELYLLDPADGSLTLVDAGTDMRIVATTDGTNVSSTTGSDALYFSPEAAVLYDTSGATLLTYAPSRVGMLLFYTQFGKLVGLRATGGVNLGAAPLYLATLDDPLDLSSEAFTTSDFGSVSSWGPPRHAGSSGDIAFVAFDQNSGGTFVAYDAATGNFASYGPQTSGGSRQVSFPVAVSGAYQVHTLESFRDGDGNYQNRLVKWTAASADVWSGNSGDSPTAEYLGVITGPVNTVDASTGMGRPAMCMVDGDTALVADLNENVGRVYTVDLATLAATPLVDVGFIIRTLGSVPIGRPGGRPPLGHRQRADGAATAGAPLAQFGAAGGARPFLAHRQNTP